MDISLQELRDFLDGFLCLSNLFKTKQQFKVQEKHSLTMYHGHALHDASNLHENVTPQKNGSKFKP